MAKFGTIKTNDEERVVTSGNAETGTVGDLVAGALGKKVENVETKTFDEGSSEIIETREVEEPRVETNTKTKTPWSASKASAGNGGNGNNADIASAEANTNFKGGRTMAKQADIVNLVLNVKLADISEFLHRELDIDFNTTLKNFEPGRVMDQVADNEREAMDEIIQRIVAFGEDGTYLTTVPAITVSSSLLKSQIDDVNLVGIGINQEKPSLAKFHSKYCVPHVVDRTGGESDVFLDTATVVSLTAIGLLGDNVLRKEDIVTRNSKFAVGITYNDRDGYTVTFTNKNYRRVR
ncbi:hypothetical protein JDFnp4_169 [Fusobacterium phage JD-Fnp4]|nr:hypothetical protein JDFnp4_169 [Fusobacterium phage JD-Fnp4]